MATRARRALRGLSWDRLSRLRRQRRFQNWLTLALVALGPILAVATFLILGPLDTGAGAQLSLADFAAAAQISVADYLGGIDWTGHEEAHGWYRVMKSRPSFRPLLTEKMEGLPPPRHYSDVNS